MESNILPEPDWPEPPEETFVEQGADNPLFISSVVGVGVLVEAGLGVSSLLVGWLVGIWPAETLRWSLEGLGWGLLATAPLLGLLAVCLQAKTGRLSELRRLIKRQIAPLFQGTSWVGLALLSLAAGFGEELCFRGLIQGGLQQVAPFWAALALASLAFGLAHPITLTYVLVITVVGLYFGLVWWWTGNLLSVAIAHALYDFIALLWLRRDGRRSVGDGPPA